MLSLPQQQQQNEYWEFRETSRKIIITLEWYTNCWIFKPERGLEEDAEQQPGKECTGKTSIWMFHCIRGSNGLYRENHCHAERTLQLLFELMFTLNSVHRKRFPRTTDMWSTYDKLIVAESLLDLGVPSKKSNTSSFFVCTRHSPNNCMVKMLSLSPSPFLLKRQWL